MDLIGKRINFNRLRSIRGLDSATAGVVDVLVKSFTYTYNDANQRTRIDREDDTHWAIGYDDGLGHVTSASRRSADETPLPGFITATNSIN